MKAVKVLGNESGFVLILGLVTMVIMTVIGISIMMNMNVDMHLSRNEREAKVAFQLADAGINETITRLHLPSSNARYIGEIVGEADYRTTAWNVGNTLGKDFGFGLGGDRNSADNLNYDVAITYLDEDAPYHTEGFTDGDADTDEVVMFGQDFNIAASMTPISVGRQPVYRVRSTGTAGSNTERTIEAYVGASSLNTDTNAGLNSNTCVGVGGVAAVLESVIQDDTCVPNCATLLAGGTVASCTETAPADDVFMDTFLGDDIADIIDFADEKHQCLGDPCGTAPGADDDIPSSGAIDTIVSDWGDFAGDTYSTMVYINNFGGKDVSLTGDYTGRGILIVRGDLTISGNFQYEGLVYVYGTLTLAGGASGMNVTGGVIADSAISVSGNINVDYDQETLNDVSRQSSASAMLIWKRL